MSILVEQLTHIYNPGTPTARVALHDVSMRIEEGSCAAIVGVTGSGKSTLVQHFNGLLRPTSGRIEVHGVEVSPHAGKGAGLRELRRHVGLLFQFPEAQLFAPTIFDDVAFGPRQLGLDEATVRRRVRRALASVALECGDAFLSRSPFALSGGQRRRVALAGVLAMKPRVLVLDEPSAGLDAEARDELYEQLVDLRTRDGLTIVLVSHDMGEVARLADTLFILSHGELKLSGSPDALFRRTEEIAAYGLLPPPLAQVAALAGTYRLPLSPPRLTIDDLADSILSLHATRTHRDESTRATGGSHDAE
ncbi:MAG: energy-coupling factor transporter ATPase [Ktedonobacterales bacterium]